MRRALLAAAFLLPSAALAQSRAASGQLLEPDNYSTTNNLSYVNLAQCGDTTASPLLALEWWISVTSGTFIATGTYNIYATNTQPTADTSGATFCAEANDPNKSIQAAQIGSATVSASIQQLTVSGVEAAKAAGKACDAGTGDGSKLWICAHWYDAGSTRRGVAIGTFVLQLKAPAAPTNVSAQSGDQRLKVSWTPGTGGAVDADHYVVTATNGTETHYASVASGGTATATVSGLTNGVTYTVTVEAFSIGGNPSGPSASASGTPLHVANFWEYYKDMGGRETGGCASGSAGSLALLGALALLAVRRRK